MDYIRGLVRVGFLASHNGSAVRRILERNGTSTIKIEPSVLITNNSNAGCLDLAAAYGIPSRVINKFKVEEDNIDREIHDEMIRHKTDLIIMAGYMKKLGPLTLQAFSGKILNAHPALLPKFGGKGMYGRFVHEAVIAAKERESGVTVHLADSEYDTGPIVTQIKITLADDETVESLEERIKELEADAYLQAVEKLTMGV